jgi:hypothetical protein
MFARYRHDSAIDREITIALKELETVRDDPDKYAAAVARITRLKDLKSTGLKPPTADILCICAANIFGVLWVARYERENVIKSREALRLVMRAK